MNIIHRNPKTVSRPEGSSLTSSSGFLRRTFPALIVLAVWFVLVAGWGIGVDAVYADTLEVWVSTDDDDAEESASGSIDLTSSDLELIRSGDQKYVGMRFTNINIPQGAIINNAYIEFSVDETDYDEATTLVFHGQAHNNATAFTSTALNISTRATTTASVTWNIAAGDQWTPAHTKYQSPDLASIIQEIVDRSGWESNNALVIIVSGAGKRVAESYDGADGHGDVTLAPKLFVDHEGGSDQGTTCRIHYRDNIQTQASSTTSLSAAAPSVEEGDLMIATVAFGNGDAVLSAPAGWTAIEPSSPGSEAMRTSAWYKVAGASESGPYVFSASGAGDEMLVDIATFYSSAGAAVLAWDLEDSSYKYAGVADKVINSNKVDCVDTSLIYFAGSDDIAANVASRPSGMTVLAEQQQSLLSLATYYQFRDSGKDLIKTIEWADPASFLSAIAAVFSCQSVVEYDIDATAGINGSISPSGVINVPDGGSKTFSIIPDSGYEVLDVVVDGNSEGAVTSYTFNNVKENHTIAASFTASSFYIISTSPGSNGTISPPGPVAVAPGADQTFTIIPDDGYVVDEVTVDGKNKGAQTSWTFSNVSEGHTIAATFEVDTADPPDDSCVEISDFPLDARFESAPPNILIALDDSGSMSFEILVPGAYDGRYLDYNDYLFDNPCGDTWGNTPGCHEYNRGTVLDRGGRRLHWKTQWSGFNKVYYDPTIDYEPWPLVTGSMDNADANNPQSHPRHPSPTFDLSSSFDIITLDSFEIIADDEDAGIFTKTGPWQEYSGVAGSYKDHYYSARQGETSYKAVWTPYVPGGTYKVYARWVDPLNDRMKNVPYKVVHKNGTDTVYVDQTSNEGNWYELGIFTFNSGPAEVSMNFTTPEGDDDEGWTACADAIRFVPEGTWTIDIPRAHYYVMSETENKPYLVFVDGGLIEYFEFNDDDSDDVVDSNELTPVVTPPADVQTGRTYVEERQNFANWYSYYRRRGFTATYATAELITNMQAVRIGLYGINIGKDWTITQPVLNVKNDGQDYTETLLNLLYDFKWMGGTPLRRALEAGGRYFDKHDNKKLDGSSGDDSPWDTAENGGECQQAFTIVITDGYYNGSDPQASGINNNDGDKGEPFADPYSDTLADVAMYYYERDLNTDLADNVPENASDDASHQHMVTYTIGFGVIGTINPNDYDDDLKHKTTEDYIVWPDATVGKSTPEKVDDVWHAAVNGRGEFLNSSNPKELVEALQAVMKDIESRVFSASGVAINGDQLYQTLEPDLLMFQASYSSEGWTGEIKAFRVDEFTGEVNTLDPEWSAAETLDDKVDSLGWIGRLIATHNGTTGIPFRFDSLTDAQKTQLDADWATDDTHARNIMDYLHGDTSNEARNGGTLRSRFSVLGDIVHSAPAFKNDILYAGSNDGMLHAFAATTGEELFAYVPNLVFENLHALADPLYQHQYYVDLAPTVKDVDLSPVSTMLVGGLGKGGRGYFALDLSDLTPTNIPATESLLDDRVMWEYPDGTTPSTEVEDLGYSFSKVALVRSNDFAKPWIVIFGNGYNSVNGYASLFILDAATGDLLKRIDTGVGTCNGLSTPIAVDVDDNNTVDYVYAGDLRGNLWKFDLSADDYTQWNVAYNDLGTPKPLFQTPPGQPITTKPSVMYHCKKHGYIVTFGTGQYLGLDDLADNSQQAVYGIWDYGDDEDDSEYVGAFDGTNITNSNLPVSVSLLQQIVVDERTIYGWDLRTLGDGNPDWQTTTAQGGSCGNNSGTEDCDPNDIPSVDADPDPDPLKNVGWYFNLPESGERVVTDVRIRAGLLTVISYVNTGTTCGLAGHSWVMVMDPCTGGRLSKAHFDINGDRKIDDQDLINIGTVDDPNYVSPTALKIEGKAELPSYLIDKIGGVEIGYYNTSDNEAVDILTDTPTIGMTYWRVLRD